MLAHTIGSLLERAARAYGPETAVVAGADRITYAEQMARVRRTGRALLGLGLRRGDRVALLMSDRPELLDAYYGALWAGLAVVPLNARLGEADHHYILADSGARVAVHDEAHAERVSRVRDDTAVEMTLCADAAGVLDGGDLLGRLAGRQPDGPGRPDVSPADRYGLYYTGGTTGRPKGVEHTHATFTAAVVSELVELGLGERDRFVHVAPLTHASGAFALPVWLRGGTNIILGGFDPERFAATVTAEAATATLLVPTMLYVLLDTLAPDRSTLPSLSTVIYGASPIGTERLIEAIERFGPVFAQLYGQTEVPNQITTLSKADHAEAVASGDRTALASCGRPVTIAEVRVVDSEDREVADGDAGEIAVRGPHVMVGYWNRPEETAAALRDGWLHTGDVARCDERGRLHIVDRTKDMIISGGYNVYPKEVEEALFTHPAVRDACVIGVPDAKWGEAVKALVVADPRRPADAAELIAWVKDRKGSVQAPKSVDFVDTIPVTALGKHDKRTLRAAYWEGHDRAVN